jgi:hypothetical protein
MTELAAFFEESQASVGTVFYPKDFIFGAFPSYAAAQRAYQTLANAGVPPEEMLTATGPEVLRFFKEHKAKEGIWGNFIREASRFIDTEARFEDEDIQHARQGAGFLTVHCLTEEDAMRIGDLLRPLAPKSMEWYRTSGVQSLV